MIRAPHDRLRHMDGQVMQIDLDMVGTADAAAVDAVARLALAAKRQHFRLRLTNPSDELLDLLALMGLSEVFEP